MASEKEKKDKVSTSEAEVPSENGPFDEPERSDDEKEIDVNKLLYRINRLEKRVKALEKDEHKELPMETITAVPLDGAIKALSSLALSPSSQASFKKMCPYLFEE